MFKATSDHLKSLGITGPTFLVDEARARANIRRMENKATASNVIFRPHFKTHQSARIGGWFRDAGVERITVSSVSMAEHFAEAGWNDITIAFLVNPLEAPRLKQLTAYLESRGGSLGVTIDSEAGARAVRGLKTWIKVDTGYGRTGVRWDDEATLRALAPDAVGLLTHAGQGYAARRGMGLQELWEETATRLRAARDIAGRPDLLLSAGDTPTCCAGDPLTGVDEVRPGNFVFGDLMQVQIGSMSPRDLAAAVALPVVGLYPDRGQIVVHGGAVHLSKESLTEEGAVHSGRIGALDFPPGGNPGLGPILAESAIVSLSQEHGVIDLIEGHGLEVGDLVVVWPVHSCLTCDLLRDLVILQKTCP